MQHLTANRRFFLQMSAAACSTSTFGSVVFAKPEDAWQKQFADEIKKIEQDSEGRLGVAVLDTETGSRGGYRQDERFPICSTFKLLASSAILKRVDIGKESLDRRIRFTADDVVANSPTTKDHVGGDGMSLAEICEAAITLSDNTAGNLLLASLGGPKGLTAFARSIGDPVTRLDRTETSLNESIPGDVRDTTSPRCMTLDIQKLTLGNVLSDASKGQLLAWLKANKTSTKRFRAATPDGWLVGDKTGSGERGSTSDVGLIWPPQRKPVIVSVYLTNTPVSADQRSATLADVARAVVNRLKS